MRHRKSAGRWFVLIAVLALISGSLLAQASPESSIQVNFGNNESFTLPVRILVVMTLLVFLPAMILSMTSFTRIIIVAHFLRQALGTQTAPPNQILIGLSLFLTFFIMAPVWDQLYRDAIVPYQEGIINENGALEAAAVPMRRFMLRQVREDDLALFVKIGQLPRPENAESLPMRVV